jgi:hypothetical protein
VAISVLLSTLAKKPVPVAAVALVMAFAYTLPSLAVAKKPHHDTLLVPGKSIGPVFLGESETDVHIGPRLTNGPGSFFYRDYSLTVAFKHGKAVAISTNSNEAFDPKALVFPYQYQTRTHPNVSIGNPMDHVPLRYPHAKCAHHVISLVPSLQTENCLLHGHHGQTFFAGRAEKQGETITIGAIVVTIPTAGPQKP